MYQCFVSAGGNGIGGGRNMAGIAAAGGYRQEAQASSELRLGGEKIYNIFFVFQAYCSPMSFYGYQCVHVCVYEAHGLCSMQTFLQKFCEISCL